MPIYEYKCNDCGRDFEYLVMGSSDQVSCPHCHSAKVSKQVSSFAVTGGDGLASLGSSSGGCGSGGFS